jgi:hypothetical protein
MEAASSESHAVSRPRPSWRARLRAFILNIHPQWWGSATLWLLAGMFLLMAGGYPSLPLSRSQAMVNFSFSQATDGSWEFNGPNSRGDLNFFGSYSYSEGLGWKRWDHIRNGIAPGSVNALMPPAGMTLDEVVTLGRKGYRQLMDDPGHLRLMHGHQETPVVATGLSMLSRNQNHYAAGPLITVSPYLLGLGAAALLLGLVMAVARQAMRIRFFHNITTAESGRCPRCGYSLTGLGAESICPECGLDVSEAVQQARRELL